MSKPLPDRIAELKARKDKLEARLSQLSAKAKQVDRKRDTRRKIVVGAAILVEVERNPRLAAFLRDMLGKAVTRDQDRDVIADLLAAPVQAPKQDMPAIVSERLPADEAETGRETDTRKSA